MRILGRSTEWCAATVHELTVLGSPDASQVTCDLSRLDDVRAAVREIGARFGSLDAPFVNAGLGYAPSRVETVDGLDAHFQVN